MPKTKSHPFSFAVIQFPIKMQQTGYSKILYREADMHNVNIMCINTLGLGGAYVCFCELGHH